MKMSKIRPTAGHFVNMFAKNGWKVDTIDVNFFVAYNDKFFIPFSTYGDIGWPLAVAVSYLLCDKVELIKAYRSRKVYDSIGSFVYHDNMSEHPMFAHYGNVFNYDHSVYEIECFVKREWIINDDIRGQRMYYGKCLDDIVRKCSMEAEIDQEIKMIERNPEKYPEFDFLHSIRDKCHWAENAIKFADSFNLNGNVTVLFKMILTRVYRKTRNEWCQSGRYGVGSEPFYTEVANRIEELHPEYFKPVEAQ